ncbi:MAG TPA: hypothetical protein VGL95_12415, partial [Acetobacteraceae bacterium]
YHNQANEPTPGLAAPSRNTQMIQTGTFQNHAELNPPEWKQASGSTPMSQRVRDQISNRLRLVCRSYVRA